MLKALELHHLGPAEHLRFEFADRLNVITGDNGLGKSFILDVAWWALTRQWAGLPAWPRPAHVGDARIVSQVSGKRTLSEPFVSAFDQRAGDWPVKGGRPSNPGLVLFAQVNAGFAVWDPARNYWRNAPTLGIEQPDRPPAFVFRPEDVWEGLRRPATDREQAATRLKEHVDCQGLLLDWVQWQTGATEADRAAFAHLETVLAELSPSDAHRLSPGEPMELPFTGDARRVPTVVMPYDGPVPAHYVSAGVRRIMGLAYLLVWSWQKHMTACASTGQSPAKRITILVDEIEAHLHPQWQRRILRALIRVAAGLESSPKVQVLAATHSPLVVASLEPLFDGRTDRLWVFDLDGDRVVVRKDDFHARGTADRWLKSTVFDLDEPGSVEAENALKLARAVLIDDAATDGRVAAAEAALVEARLLAPGSAFGARWAWFKKKRSEGRT